MRTPEYAKQDNQGECSNYTLMGISKRRLRVPGRWNVKFSIQVLLVASRRAATNRLVRPGAPILSCAWNKMGAGPPM